MPFLRMTGKVIEILRTAIGREHAELGAEAGHHDRIDVGVFQDLVDIGFVEAVAVRFMNDGCCRLSA